MNIMTALTEKAIERSARLAPVKMRKLPNPYTLQEWAILGTYSYTMMQTKRRLLRYDGLRKLEAGQEETLSAIARDYLKIEYGKSPTIKHSQAEIYKASSEQIKNAPRFFTPGKFEQGFYIDIESTYWTVMLVSGWNLDYYPKKWLAPGRPPESFPFAEDKTARSCLVSVARPGEILQYNPEGKTQAERFPTRKTGSPIINMGISKLISDVLHAIAGEAVKLGAVYVNTDGYIAPSEKIAAAIGQMIFDWGLPARVKAEGRGEVLGSASYNVGGLASEPYKAGLNRPARGQTESPWSKLYPIEYSNWLQPRFAKLASRSKVVL